MKEWICREISTSTGDNENGVLMIETELIRCKDCKHWQKSVINYNEYVCYWGGYVKNEDDFCSWAVRKEKQLQVGCKFVAR